MHEWVLVRFRYRPEYIHTHTRTLVQQRQHTVQLCLAHHLGHVYANLKKHSIYLDPNINIKNGLHSFKEENQTGHVWNWICNVMVKTQCKRIEAKEGPRKKEKERRPHKNRCVYVCTSVCVMNGLTTFNCIRNLFLFCYEENKGNSWPFLSDRFKKLATTNECCASISANAFLIQSNSQIWSARFSRLKLFNVRIFNKSHGKRSWFYHMRSFESYS